MTYQQLYKWIDEEKKKYQLRFSKAETITVADAAEMMLEFLEDFEHEIKIKETEDECKSNYNKIPRAAGIGTVGSGTDAIC